MSGKYIQIHRQSNKIIRLMLLSFAIIFGEILQFVFVSIFIDGSGNKSTSTDMYLGTLSNINERIFCELFWRQFHHKYLIRS